jgi:hypothetical protein
MVNCAACRHRRERCGNQCPTQNLFHDQEEYSRVHKIFTYGNIRRWIFTVNSMYTFLSDSISPPPFALNVEKLSLLEQLLTILPK